LSIEVLDMKFGSRLPLTIMSIVAVSGCSSLMSGYGNDTRRGVSSSLVDYLYPNGEQPPKPEESIPQLRIPLRVGLAFVPVRSGADAPGLSEADKNALLEKVRAAFIDQDFISDIVVIPDTYLRGGSGFQGLEQVSRLYQVPVMALVSYDQVASSSETNASFLYWTIVGAYTIEGTKNEVRTFVDTAIFDIQSKRLLFRAPGIHVASGKSTLATVSDEILAARRNSFSLAMDDMNTNLLAELDRFKVRVTEDPGVAQVVRADGSGGGGMPSPALLLLLGGLLLSRQFQRKTGAPTTT
jgi:rhombotail lipoprotein